MGSMVGRKAIGKGSLVGNGIRAQRLMMDTTEVEGFSMKWSRMVQSKKKIHVT